jgi:hypothetical protein
MDAKIRTISSDCRFEDIKFGQCFMHYGTIFMKVSHEEFCGCLDLKTGIVGHMPNSRVVRPLKQVEAAIFS